MTTGRRPTLLADIGGTHARFVLLDADGARTAPVTELPSLVFSSFAEVVRAGLERLGPEAGSGWGLDGAAIAVAGPVVGDRVEFSNTAWSFSIEATRRELGLERLLVVNDLEACAWALPVLDAEQFDTLQAGSSEPGSPAALVAVGTGLGVAIAVPRTNRDRKAFNEGGTEGDASLAGQASGSGSGESSLSLDVSVLPSEGGHADLAASTGREWAVVERLRARFGRHVSAERAVSGNGLSNLWRALAEIDGEGVAEGEAPDGARIAAGARAGEARAREVVALFSAWLGAFAGDLALTAGARGGIDFAGGVMTGLGDAFDVEAFLARFNAKGRLRSWIAAVPVRRVLVDELALAGLAHLVARG